MFDLPLFECTMYWYGTGQYRIMSDNVAAVYLMQCKKWASNNILEANIFNEFEIKIMSH